MTLFIIALVSGMLTVLAPCVLPVLPVILGTVASSRSRWTPYVVVGSLSVSIILFTLLLKTTTVFIVIPGYIWEYISGGILILFGVTLMFPYLWKEISVLTRVTATANTFIGKGQKRRSYVGDMLVGASLGPIFSTCSPTYFVILGTVLPLNFFLGVFYIGVYTLGLALVLLAIAIFGSTLVRRLSILADPHGLFKRIVGVFFVILGIMIALGLVKEVEVWVLDHLLFDVTTIEYSLLERFIYE